MKHSLILGLLLLSCFSIGIQACDEYGNGCNTGLYSGDGSSLTLIDLQTYVKIKGSYAYVEHVQTYENYYSYDIDMIYYYSKEEYTMISKFEALSGEKKIATVLIDKEEAGNLYKQYGKPDDDDDDDQYNSYSSESKSSSITTTSKTTKITSKLLKIYCGTVSAYQKIVIKICLIIPVKVICNQYYGFSMFSTLTYHDLYEYGWKDVPNFGLTPIYNSKVKHWKIKIDIYSVKKFASIKNPTHKLSPTIKYKKGYYIATWDTKIKFKKDFVIYWKYKQMYEPEIYITKHSKYDIDWSIMINLVPKLNEFSYDVSKYLNQGKKISTIDGYITKYESEYVKGEYIFVVDCTSYMTKTKIEKVKKAIIQFFKDIPHDCYFNIIAYGTSVSYYSKSSTKYSYESVQKAIKWVNKKIVYTSGQIDIYDAISFATSIKVKKDYPRTIYCFSSGKSSYKYETISHVYKHKDKMKICGIGLGYGSDDLVEGIGNAGQCGYHVVDDDKQIEIKSSYIIKQSISYSISNVKADCHCYNKYGNVIWKTTEYDAYVFKNKAYSKFIQVAGVKSVDYCSIKLEYYNSYDEKIYSKTYKTYVKNAEVSDIYHQIGYSQKAEIYSYQSYEKKQSEMTKIKKSIVDWSKKYQFASEYTLYVSAMAIFNLYSSKSVKSGDSNSYQQANDQTYELMANDDESIGEYSEYEPIVESIDSNVLMDVQVKANVDVDVKVNVKTGDKQTEEPYYP